MKIDFWTSTELPGFMESLITELNALGFQASQRFLISEASYRAAKSPAQRLWLRLRQYLLYPAYLLGSLIFGKKAEVIVVCTNTFYAPLLATFFHKRVVHLVYDLFPEALRGEAALECASATRNERNLRLSPFVPKAEALVVPPDASALQGGFAAPRYPLIRRLVGMTLRRAVVNVFLGERLRDYVLSHYDDVRNPVVIPVGAAVFGGVSGQRSEGRAQGAEVGVDEVPERIPPPDLSSLTSDLITLLYCGNLGRMHDLETVKEFWEGRGQRGEVRDQDAGLSEGPAPGTRASCPPREPRAAETRPSGHREAEATTPGGKNPNVEHRPPPPLSPPLSPIPSPLSSEPASASPSSAHEVRFLFHCSGPKKPQLEAAVADLSEELRARIHIGGGLGPEEWREVMLSSQVALVTMIPGAEKVVMPSKTYSAMMASQAILAIAPEESDLGDLVKQADCGWVIAPGDVTALRQVLQQVQTEPDTVSSFQKNARSYALAHYSMTVLAQTWADTLKTLRE